MLELGLLQLQASGVEHSDELVQVKNAVLIRIKLVKELLKLEQLLLLLKCASIGLRSLHSLFLEPHLHLLRSQGVRCVLVSGTRFLSVEVKLELWIVSVIIWDKLTLLGDF